MRMMLNRRDNGEDGRTENTQGRPDSSYSLQELLIFPQPMIECRKKLNNKSSCARQKCVKKADFHFVRLLNRTGNRLFT